MKDQTPYVVGIGASAGGFEVIRDFVSLLPYKINAAFVIVRHLPIEFATNSDRLLAKYTRLKVCIATDQQSIEAGCIYIINGNKIATMKDNKLQLRERMSQEIVNMAVDKFLVSLAYDAKEKAVGVILSGGGTDGANGLKYIHECGGIGMVQDPDTAEFKSMPQAAISTDHPTYILEPGLLVQKLVNLVLAN